MSIRKGALALAFALALSSMVSSVSAQSAPFFWDAQIMSMLMDIMGSPILLGVFAFAMIYMIGLAFRLTLEIQMLVLLFFSFIFLQVFMPQAVVVVFLIAGIGIGIFLIYTIFSR